MILRILGSSGILCEASEGLSVTSINLGTTPDGPRLAGYLWARCALASVTYLVITLLQFNEILHPFLLVSAMAVIDLITGGRHAVDRLLLCTTLFIGVVPIFGWVNVPNWFDPVALVSTYWLVTAVFTLNSGGWRRISHSVVALPTCFAAWFSFDWWRGISRGSPAELLERFLPIWDLSAHFNFFLMNLTKGTYINRAPVSGTQYRWVGIEYPAGIHYLWSRFAHGARGQLTLHPERAIAVFANMVVVSVVATVVVLSLSLARLGESVSRRFSYAAIGAGIGVGLMVLGPLSQTIYAGFANMPAVIMGLAVVVSIHVRPLDNVVTQTVALSAASLALVYNWYPTALLVLPVVVLHGFRLLRSRNWIAVLGVGLPALVCAVPPVLQTLSLGIKHLDLQGGVQGLSPGVLVAIVLGAAAVTIMTLADRSWTGEFLLGLPPVVLLLALAVRLRLTTGQYPYYFHKATLYVVPFSVLVIAATLIGVSESSCHGKTLRKSQRILLPFGSLLLATALSQFFGYWGFDYPTFGGGSTAVGVLTRNDIVKGSTVYLPTAEVILREARATRNLPIKERTCLTLVIPTRLGTSDGTTNDPWMGTLANVWYHALTDSYNQWSMSQAYMTVNIAPALTDESALVDSIAKTFDPPSVCIFSTATINARLREKRPDWQTRDLLGE